MLSPVGFRPAASTVRFGKLNPAQEDVAKALGADPSKINDGPELKKAFLDQIADGMKDFKLTGKYRFGSDFLNLGDVIEVMEHVFKKNILPLGEKLGKFKLDIKDSDSLEGLKEKLSQEDQDKVMTFLDKELPQALGLPDGEALNSEISKVVEPLVEKKEQD